MKKILIFLLLLCPLTMMAQREPTKSGYHQWDILGEVHAGATASKIQGVNVDPLFRPTGGIGIEMMALNNFGVSFEMNFHYLGALNRTVQQNMGNGNWDRTNAKIWMSYLDTEYHLKWYMLKGLTAYTGISMGTLLYAKVHSNDGTRHADIRDDCKHGRFAIPVGVTKYFGNF